MNTLKKIKNLIPIIILGIFCLSTIIQTLLINPQYVLHINHILGCISVIVCIVFYFKLRKHFRTAVIATLILGLVGLLNFTVAVYRFNVGPLSLELVSLLTSFLYLILNFTGLKEKYIGSDELEILPDLSAIKKYKLKYSHLSDQELEELKKDPRFMVEVKMAVEEILNDRRQ